MNQEKILTLRLSRRKRHPLATPSLLSRGTRPEVPTVPTGTYPDLTAQGDVLDTPAVRV